MKKLPFLLLLIFHFHHGMAQVSPIDVERIKSEKNLNEINRKDKKKLKIHFDQESVRNLKTLQFGIQSLGTRIEELVYEEGQTYMYLKLSPSTKQKDLFQFIQSYPVKINQISYLD